MKPRPDYEAPCPSCKQPIGDHTLRGYAAELTAAGFDYSEPFHDIPSGATVSTDRRQIVGEVQVAAAVIETAIGVMPMLRFEFFGPGNQPMERRALDPVLLLMDAKGLRSFRDLVAASVDRAIVAALEYKP